MCADVSRIRVEAPARLHLGFLDPGASSGRQFGSIGLALDTLATVVSVAPAAMLEVSGPDAERARGMLDMLLRHYGLPRTLAVRIEAAIPAHAGLGSGTQLALAVGVALLRACGREANSAEIGALLGRGRRSGIGLNLFEHGGLVVDAGRGPHTVTPPLISRLAFPEDWRVLLIFDETHSGLTGGAELSAFGALPAMPAVTAAHLCQVTLLGVLPAIAEADFPAFSRGIGEIQAVVGDHFAAVQSGRYTSSRVEAVIRFIVERYAVEGVGQSSWGPTAFAFIDSAIGAKTVLSATREAFAAVPGLRFQICGGRNRGASITPQAAATARRVVAG